MKKNGTNKMTQKKTTSLSEQIHNPIEKS